MNNSSTVITKHLTHRFGKFTAVNDVNLDVKKGEIFGFLGANGAGKTTTIRILCGLLKATEGRVIVNGIDGVKQPEKIKRCLGYMSQKFSLYEDLKVKDNMIFFGGVYGLPNKQLKKRIKQVAQPIGLDHLLQRTVNGLPTGWKQRLALACAILHDPKIIFLDEPTGGVDPLSRRRFWEFIYYLAEKGKTVFVTTHYMDEAEYCHRIAIMYRGRILTTNTPSQIRQLTGKKTLDDAFVHLIQMEIEKE